MKHMFGKWQTIDMSWINELSQQRDNIEVTTTSVKHIF